MLLPPASTEDRLPAVTNRLLYLLLLLANWTPPLAPTSMEDRLHDFRALGGEESVAVAGDDRAGNSFVLKRDSKAKCCFMSVAYGRRAIRRQK